MNKNLAFVVVVSLGVASLAYGHSPDPTFGGPLYSQDQLLTYKFKSGYTPPSWMRPAINAAATDSNSSRASRAAVFKYVSTGRSNVSYAEPNTCSPRGIACMSRNAPYSFWVSYRRQGYSFDWGRLRWCQYYRSWPDGCFDVENISLDEFGHVEILQHHVNYSSGSDYRDAIVQTTSRAKPRSGYNVHRYAPCDTATLQLKYDVQSPTSKISTCLRLGTKTTLTAGDTQIATGATVRFTARLKVATSAFYGRLSGNSLAGRIVKLQRRVPGSSTWTTVKTMTVSGNAYVASAAPGRTYEWRAVFSTSGEGVRSSFSSALRVTTGG